MYNSEIYHTWLDQYTDRILSKVNRETITTEEMLVLILKDQSKNFSLIDERFKKVDERFEKVDAKFEKVDARIEKVEKKMDDLLKWAVGVIIPMLITIIIKLFTQ